MEQQTSQSRSPTIRIIAAVAWTIVILALCSIPGRDLPEVEIVSADKAVHFTLFATLAWLWMHSLSIPVRIRLFGVLAGGLAYAVLTEVYQGLMPIGREPDVWDSIANAAGLVAGVALWWLRRNRSGRVAPD